MSDQHDKTLAQEMAERLAEEAAAESQPAAPEITIEDVVSCMWRGEKGDGELFARLMAGKLANAPELKGQWLKFGGVTWQDAHVHEVEKEVERVAILYDETRRHFQAKLKDLHPEADKDEYKRIEDIIKNLRASVYRNRSRKGISATCRLALTEPSMIIELSRFDTNPMLLACASGVIDLATGQHRQARPEDYLRRCSPVAWQGIEPPYPEKDDSAEAPPFANMKDQFHAFVRQLVGDNDDVAAYMQRLMGYAITGKADLAVFSVFTGEGRNGKSLFIKTLEAVLGNYMAPIPAEMLLDQGYARNADNATPSIMALRGLRLAFASETDENRKFSTSKVKWLTGGDTLVGRYPWDRDPISFPPSHKLVLLTNHKPWVKSHEQAFFDRLLIVNFPYRFVDRPRESLPHEKPRDPALEEKLLAIQPGILAWLVEGCLLYQQRGLDPPPEVLQATEDYRREQDQLRDFVEDCLLYQEGERVSAKDLYQLYLKWHEANRGGKQPSQTSFGNQIKHHLKNKQKVGGIYFYYDYVIKPEANEQFTPGTGHQDSGGQLL